MIQAICWTLVHSLWQGLVFGLMTGLFMLLTKRASAVLRYNVLCVLFFLFLGVSAATFLYEWNLSGSGILKEGNLPMTWTVSWMAGWIEALGQYCSDHAVPVVWGWLFVFSVKSLHMMGSFLYTQRLRSYGISPAPEVWRQKVDSLRRKLGIDRAVKLVESKIVKVPMVIGHWQPVIFIPLGLLLGLPEEEIEAVLLHELAHIRRNDYVVNLLQSIAINLFFFNPGLLWISALLQEEREHCCDDIAIAGTCDRVTFVRALINFKEHNLRLSGVSNAFPAGKNLLLKRVMRIAQNSNKTLDPAEKIFLALSFVVIFLLISASINKAVPMKSVKVISAIGARPEKKSGSMNVVLPVRDRVEPVRMRAAAAVAIDKRDKEQAMPDKEQAKRDAEQALRDKSQADRDRNQAERDKQQAERDKQQAERDAQQAIRDKEQAARDREQTEKRKAEFDAEKKRAFQ